MEEIKYMVIGNPARHSRSPAMQNAAFEYYGLGRPYSWRELETGDLPEFAELARRELLGFNITAPFKQNIIEFCDVIDAEARAARSVNTVKITDGKMYGYTTDGFGFRESLRLVLGIEPAGRRFGIIGAGGAARAIAAELSARGAAAVMIANRTRLKAEELAAEVGGAAVETDEAVEADCVINCTSLGLRSGDPSPLSAAQLKRCKAVFDTVYLPTALQKAARERGIPVADGRYMLLYQGARAFEIWTGLTAPVEIMKKALFSAPEAEK